MSSAKGEKMQRIKRRTLSGSVCEQEIFTVAANCRNLKNAEPRERFKTEAEREQHRIDISRRHHARIFNTNFTPQSLYTTLTLDNDHEVHTFDEADKIKDLYIRRLRRINPDAQIIFYMGRGKSTNRIHFHMVSNGISAEAIREKWKAGKIIRIENLRERNYYNGVDHGRDYTGLANYLFNHWTQEQGGHRWRGTRNLRQPEREEPTVIKREYSASKPPRPPKGYRLVEYRSNQYGYQYFKYVKDADERPQRMRC